MGLYDTFVLPEYRCQHCGHKYEAKFQTKDFGDDFSGGWMETVKLGQDLRKPVKRVWLWYSTSGLLSKKISRAKAEKLANDKRHYDVQKSGAEYYLYKILKPAPIFFACNYKVFNMYDSCPKCKKWIDERGLIRNWKFMGVQGKGAS
ncbi:MAG: hypothetical protein ACYCPP_00640 [Nitrososphaerales archaeon]